MQVSGINTEYVLPDPPPAKSNFLDQAAFLQLLTAQLATQNPLEPMSDRDFFAQMAQLGLVQGVDRLAVSMQASQAANLLGKQVMVRTDDAGIGNGFAKGRVEAVESNGQRVFVVIAGVRHPLESVMKITG